MATKYNSRLDFYEIREKHLKANNIEIYPDYIVDEDIKDLMIRGSEFYAVWDPEKEIWNRKATSVKRIVDRDVTSAFNIAQKENPEVFRTARYLRSNSSGKWAEFKAFIRNLPDMYVRLDEKVSFRDMSDSSKIVDYRGVKVKKDDYISKCLPYSLQKDAEAPPAWDELISTLFLPDERRKIEWAIGAIISGDAKKIQKFLVLYGKQGSGKSTILNIVMKLFDGYCATFKAENLVRGGDNFNLDFLSEDPLVAIDADTNLSKIESNVLINQIASHEQVKVNEKFKNKYPNKPICMMMLGTNQQVKITDAKSGIIRRLIDVESSEKLIPEDHYYELLDQIDYELGAIAGHCLKVYKSLGRTYYSSYVPIRMMYRSDPFFNFIVDSIYPYMKEQENAIKNGESVPEGIQADALWNRWKAYCQDSGIEHMRKRYEIFDEAQNYFEHYYKTSTRIKNYDRPVRNWFSGFRYEKVYLGDLKDNESLQKKPPVLKEKINKVAQASVSSKDSWLVLDQTKSLLDDILAEYPAQYETSDKEHPLKYKWEKVKTKLKDLDTTKTHYVKGPGQLIFMDFDKRDETGKKNLELNLKAAAKMAPKKTYAELSNSGVALHLLYWYDGNVNDLSSISDDPEVEIKVFPEDQLRSMRRRLTKCNSLPIAHISSGLPLKEKKAVINWDGVKDDRHLRNLILQAIKKECRPYGEEPKTVTCVKYIGDILKNAQASGMKYDIRDLGEAIYSFAANSHNNKKECISMYYDMELMWPKEVKEPTGAILDGAFEDGAPIIILDCEVVQNLLLVIYKELGANKKCIRLYNPNPGQIEKLMQMRIVGHNVTGYDNYILYAAWLGYSPYQIFELSQRIIAGERTPWREARNISYTDTLDVASEKKSLKKIEIELHIPHKEMEIDWSKPLPESEWERLAQYCENDVLATEAYFLSKKWQADFKARKILAALTGMTVNDSTNNLVAQLIFGDVREPWHEFVYPDLKKEFPPYRYEYGKSYYFDELIGEGGRVYAEPGMYYNVVTFDVASMHPTSIIVENGFGPYTKGYKDLYEARIAIKHKDYDKARKLFDGRLAPYLENEDDADDLAYALKIALNSTYGMTAASFQNRFKDPRNIDNWVAKRGALFMEKLRLEVQKRGGHVIHIKTDSIKLVEPNQELQDFVIQFGKDHGYTFEIESRYERICLVNHAVYIALRSKEDEDWLKECKKAKQNAEKYETPYVEPTRWTATGAQFAHPFVFKRLFSKEPMEFWDFCETKTVKTALYLDMNEKLQNVEKEEKEKKKIQTRIRKILKDRGALEMSALDPDKLKVEQIDEEIKDLQKDIRVLDEIIAEGHYFSFVGKAGEFVPVKPGAGGGLLLRQESDGDFGYAVGAKGYRWLESEVLQKIDNWEDFVDIRYFRGLVDEAFDTIGKYGDFEMFVHGEDNIILPEDKILDYGNFPWDLPCKTTKYAYCSDCPDFVNDENGYSCSKGYTITNQILGESKESLV